ncbi:protein of unknown function [Allopseudospirillum japonicum]|uniref:DUF4214 domain-containing protein n=1 Tax=Allopseudospirillum japonicum TaxID=64971 RepID=A0A1H6RAY3_9GAMM|nr:DUF4214 domain-containing protein [Allopseudospirillum japonicum]SEI51646.1 protein of unknown function [Allopseudospirillum japonicum]
MSKKYQESIQLIDGRWVKVDDDDRDEYVQLDDGRWAEVEDDRDDEYVQLTDGRWVEVGDDNDNDRDEYVQLDDGRWAEVEDDRDDEYVQLTDGRWVEVDDDNDNDRDEYVQLDDGRWAEVEDDRDDEYVQLTDGRWVEVGDDNDNDRDEYVQLNDGRWAEVEDDRDDEYVQLTDGRWVEVGDDNDNDRDEYVQLNDGRWAEVEDDTYLGTSTSSGSQAENGTKATATDGRLYANVPESQLSAEDAALARLYLAVFQRLPDEDGFHFWQGAARQGMELEDIAESFMQSQEFIQTYGVNLQAASFVELVYENVLGRAPDQGGQSYWQNQLAQGLEAEDMLLGFSESQEYQAATQAHINTWFAGL